MSDAPFLDLDAAREQLRVAALSMLQTLDEAYKQLNDWTQTTVEIELVSPALVALIKLDEQLKVFDKIVISQLPEQMREKAIGEDLVVGVRGLVMALDAGDESQTKVATDLLREVLAIDLERQDLLNKAF